MPMTKIVCTIGPASDSPAVIKDMIRAGMNVARLNFSHGTREGHKEKIALIRSASAELDKPVAILQDLAGPKIRVGRLPEGGIRLATGETFVLTGRDIQGNKKRVSVSYSSLPKEVREGDRILLADGTMELRVEAIDGPDIICKVITGGVLTSHKGINLPTSSIGAPALTEKDKDDLSFGLENDVDYVALSFVRKADDILSAREAVSKKNKNTPIIAKIEKHEAIKHIDEIMEASDGIMVARGDLGVEIPLENIPSVQKMLIRKANEAGKPVITATQMLRSMIASPRPTRAEATDVANAVLDGTDAVMLSEETAIGAYPIEAVRFMARIAQSTEKNFSHERYLQLTPKKDISESVAHASCVLGKHLEAKAIVALTQSGLTARHISRFRPQRPILALSPSPESVRMLCLFWGCMPCLFPRPKDTDDMIDRASSFVIDTGLVSSGDVVIITSGHPLWRAGTTNMVRVKKL